MSYRELWQRLTAVYDEGEAKAIVRWVLEECFGLSAADLYGGGVEALSEADLSRLDSIMQRLEKAEPVHYVLGVADFCERRFRVAPGVLIPRPETAELCRWIVQSSKFKVLRRAKRQSRAQSSKFNDSILDIGTGSGCIAITLALEMSGAKVTAWDISDEALRIARENADRLGASVAFEHRDALNIPPSTLLPPPSTRYDLIVSNPPYIDEATERGGMAQNVLNYEPHEALFGPAGAPDLFYRRIGDFAIGSLKPGGRLYFELNPLTAERVRAYLQELGFSDIEIRQDQFGRPRMLRAIKP